MCVEGQPTSTVNTTHFCTHSVDDNIICAYQRGIALDPQEIILTSDFSHLQASDIMIWQVLLREGAAVLSSIPPQIHKFTDQFLFTN